MPSGLIHPALQHVDIHQPEAADEERAFSSRQSVFDLVSVISQEQAVAHQVFLNSSDSSGNPRVLNRQKTDERQEQQTGIQLWNAVTLRKAVHAAIKTSAANLFVDAVLDFLPALHPPLHGELLSHAYPAIKGDPCHNFRLSELAATAAK